MPLPRVILKPKRARPFYGMHPWVFPGAIERTEGEPADGGEVDLVSHTAQFVARGLYNSNSKLRVRLYSWKENESLDDAFFRAKIKAAIRLRRDVLRLGGLGKACRLVFSESDGVSGMVVDQYDRWLVVQFTSLALAQRRDRLAAMLQEASGAEGIYLRTERGIGQFEGLELQDGLLLGVIPDEPIVIEDHGVRFRVHLTEGQKTGFYLDQRDNRVAVAQLARGRKFLDAFSYSGGFGLHARKAGASEVVCVDGSEAATSLVRDNAALNELDQIRTEKSDVFAFLDREVAAGQRYGVISLDPPKFARSGGAVDEALRGYRRLQTQALKLLEPDGILAISCCSGLIAMQNLLDLLSQNAADSKRTIQVLEMRGPSPDHPVSATCPETNYLKCIICRVA
ncbi:MAG: class I SAM-dependent rRNA methyltransferase [Gemmataceae bacterium]|nr:class I SAM-dependent rRNA methyltransferase [Gemmataceae bacterium]